MDTVPVNARIDIEDYVPPREKVTSYDFQLDQPGNRGGLLLFVWPHVGDEVKLTSWGWLFTFPRNKQSLSIYRSHVVTLTCEESERIYVDAKEMQKAIVKEAVEKRAKKHGKDEA